MEAVLLAGGLGTRLHKVTGDLYPKSLAVINGKPFLHYLIKYLGKMGITRFIFAISHHSEMIMDSVRFTFPDLDYAFSIEERPLGTGGAIKQAMEKAAGKKALVVNADSFMEFSLPDFIQFSRKNHSGLSIICTWAPDVSRFGAADISEDYRLIKFFEKGRQGQGYINSGIYLLNKNHPVLASLSGKFSFENDVLSNSDSHVYAMKIRGLFFDIGTPDDFAGAELLLKNHKHLF